MKFYTEFKTRDAAFGGGFTNGLTMAGSGSVQGCREILSESDKTVYEYGDCIVECSHIYNNNVTECRTKFTNNGKNTVTLDMLASFAIKDIQADIIHRAASFWSAEGRLITQSLVDIHMEEAWTTASTRVEKFGQVGSMPVRKWFPFLILENSAEREFIGIQLYCASSWQIEIFRSGKPLSVCGGLADFDYGHWSKNIAAGESFVTPKAVIAKGASIQEVCHRLVNAQQPHISEIDRDMPVIFNEYCTTWGNPTRENLEKIARRLEGSGIKYLVIDSGWYKEDGKEWYNTIGDWNISRDMFPDGLKETADMIKSYGLIPGLWFEMENTACETEAYNRTEHLLKRFNVPITSGGRRFWDMRDSWVVDYLSEKVIGTLRDNGFGYLKVDYNETIGAGCDGAESLGEGLRQAVCASQNFFRKIAKELPELVIENCSSGGHRLEPSMMELVSQASFSDAHECTCIPIIAANLHRLIRPEQSQIWAVLRADDDIHRIRYSLSAGFLGRLCLSGDIFGLSAEKWDEVLKAIDFYSKVKEIIRSGYTSIIRCTAKSYLNPCGYQAVLREYSDKALLIVHTFKNGANPPIEDLFKNYHITDSFGSSLEKDFRGKVFLLEK